jgi:hypothetical protein
VVRVPGYSSSGPGFVSWHHKIFGIVMSLELGSLSLVTLREKLLERKSSACGLENRDYRPLETAALTTRHYSLSKSWH